MIKKIWSFFVRVFYPYASWKRILFGLILMGLYVYYFCEMKEIKFNMWLLLILFFTSPPSRFDFIGMLQDLKVLKFMLKK